MPNDSGYRLDPFIDSVEDVLEIRKKAIEALKEGRQIVEFSGNGTEVKKVYAMPVDIVLAETRRFLKMYDPCTYGPIVRQTKVIRTT